MTPDPPGPFATEAEARAAAKALGGPPEEGWSILSQEQRHRMMVRACETAGVRLGDYDDRILRWLAGSGDGPCAVICGLVLRAAAAGDGSEEGSGG